MRIWDYPVTVLCNKHLNGQHLEIHTMWSVIYKGSKGYGSHPETIRWKQNSPLLVYIHSLTAAEMISRGNNHHSPIMPLSIPKYVPSDNLYQVDSYADQYNNLNRKECSCAGNIRAWLGPDFDEFMSSKEIDPGILWPGYEEICEK